MYTQNKLQSQLNEFQTAILMLCPLWLQLNTSRVGTDAHTHVLIFKPLDTRTVYKTYGQLTIKNFSI